MHILSLLLDVAVLIGLGFTIFYCLKLSKSMNNFRQHRGEMNKLIEILSKNIDEALRAIDGLKLAGDKSGRELQKTINDSRAMAQELQIINQSSNNLASRLEGLTDKSRIVSQGFVKEESFEVEREKSYGSRKAVEDAPSFAIQDREYYEEDEGGSGYAEEFDDGDREPVQSQAEKELLDALRKNKKPSGRGVF